MLEMENPAAVGAASGAKNANYLTANSDTKNIPVCFRDQPVDLWAELKIARHKVGRADEILARHGVTDPNARQLCGLARIVQFGKFYEPHSDGEYAIIMPVIDVDELVELIAFDPRTPNQWFQRLGGERLLGGDALGGQLLGNPLHIYRTPLSWMKRRRDGIVVFDTNHAFIDLTTAPNGILGEDDVHTEELRSAMTRTALGRLPRFLTRMAA